MTQILPCGLDLAWLLMVQLVISSLDAGQGKSQKSNAWSRGHKMRKHKLFGDFGDTQHIHLFWIKATLQIMEKKTKPHQYYTPAHLAGGGLWLVLCWLAKQLCGPWLPPTGAACRQHRTQLCQWGTWIWSEWVSHPTVLRNDAASQSATTSAWPREWAGLGGL